MTTAPCAFCGDPVPEGDNVDHLKAKHPNQVKPAAETSPPTRRRPPRVAEGKPWEHFNSDGSLNLASYAVLATAEFVGWAHRLVLAHDAELVKEEGAPVTPPDMRVVKALARRLLRAADLTQAAVRADRHIDRMDGSHARARWSVRAALRAYPVPWGADEEEKADWVGELAEHATALLVCALELLEVEPAPRERVS